MLDATIGKKLRDIRKRNGITLNELAIKTGLSISYLSLLERGINSPTIANLQNVCSNLNITMTDLLIESENDNKLLIRKNERRKIFEDEPGVLYEAVTEGARNIESICMTVYDNIIHESEPHITDEFGYLCTGSLQIIFENEVIELYEGDALYIPANTPHSYKNTGIIPSVSIWAYHKKPVE